MDAAAPRPATLLDVRSRTRASGEGTHAALASPIRRRLLALLRDSDTPCNVHDLGRVVALHPSTVRYHLETLRGAGLVVRQAGPQRGTGRPRTAYSASGRGSAGPAYEQLAGRLAANLADTPQKRATRAERVGAQWADDVVPATTGPGATLAGAVAQVSELFDRLGFEPQVHIVGADRQIALSACPFRAVAREHPEVVCSVHLGLLQGSMQRFGSPAASLLLPFVEPELCLVHLSPAPSTVRARSHPDRASWELR